MVSKIYLTSPNDGKKLLKIDIKISKSINKPKLKIGILSGIPPSKDFSTSPQQGISS